ncbi:hypothetical protein P3342_002274 [Pyrenophora teres f. teres]|nr:hypothetical protein P3342_002274 [Pyrenophora teres f. teres]
MGANQSRPSEASVNEKLMERLQALNMKDDRPMNEKDGFVVVGGEAPPKYTPGVKYQRDVSAASVSEWEKELMEDPKNRLALAALSSNPANAVLSSRSAVISDTQKFNIKIPFEGSPVTNQAASGRCWLFASTNVFRVAIMKKYKLSEFQLSQSYLFYWDKIEKANYFLESILDTKSEDIDSRVVQALMASPVGDGGQWDMVANLVMKYGLVPQSLYPDSFNAANSSTMDRLITTKLREDAVRLRHLASSNAQPEVIKSAIASEKERMLREIHLILTLMLGPPPCSTKPFTWEYYDKDGNFCTSAPAPQPLPRSSQTTRPCERSPAQTYTPSSRSSTTRETLTTVCSA